MTQEQRLEVLRVLYRVGPLYIGRLVFAILHERNNFPVWMLTAIEHGWMPPKTWKTKERSQIASVIRGLIDDHEIIIDGEWRLCYPRGAPPLRIIAEQAT